MDFELRRAARMAMRGVPERLGLEFARGNVEMRAKPNGTAAGSVFTWEGYATVFGAPFDMWDQDGEPFTELVAEGAATRTLNNPNLDVPFLIGHNSAGIPLARTKSGTMALSQDSHGVLSYVPSMDGRREEVRALASAVERGDIDEMSLAFVCTRQQWDRNFEQRTILEMDLHRGDVCAVTHGANPATAGSRMYPAEQLAFRRPAAIGAPRLLEARMPTQPYSRGDGEVLTCGQCGSGNDADAQYCDQCGTEVNPREPYAEDSGDTQTCPWCRRMNAPDAKLCDQCGRGLVNDHDGDDPGYAGGADASSPVHMGWSDGRPYELLSVNAAERDKAKKAGSSLPDGSYPINNVKQLKSAAILAASHHGDWKAAQALIRRRAKELGVDITTLAGFGGDEKGDGRPLEALASHAPMTGTHSHPHPAYGAQGGDATHSHEHSHDGDADHGHHQGARAAGMPLETRASASSDIDLADAPDTDAAAAAHERPCKTCSGKGRLPHPVTGLNGVKCPSCDGSAVVTVDDSTGIPGPEQQLAAAALRERRVRELELEELARG